MTNIMYFINTWINDKIINLKLNFHNKKGCLKDFNCHIYLDFSSFWFLFISFYLIMIKYSRGKRPGEDPEPDSENRGEQ